MSASGFRVARVRPLMGRYLVEDDEREGAASVVVIGEEVWRNRFESDPAILGRTIQLGAALHSIVGVMPKGFAFPVNHHFWACACWGGARRARPSLVRRPSSQPWACARPWRFRRSTRTSGRR